MDIKCFNVIPDMKNIMKMDNTKTNLKKTGELYKLLIFINELHS